MNFTVVRDHPEQSFHVNMRGALNVMQAAIEHGIKKVIHSGPQFVRSTYDHDFDIADVPPVLTTGYYCLTKGLASEICRTYARAHGIQTISFLFNGLGPRPTQSAGDFQPFTVVWEDLHQAVGWRWKFHKYRIAFRSSTCLAGRGTASTMLIRPDAS